MNKETYPELKCDPSFEKLIQPMNTKEAGKMIDRLIIEPSFRTISIWNGYHLNDMAKYKMCMEQDLDISIIEMSFSNHSSAASYICSSQLERQDLTEEFRKYLVGQKFSFELSLASDSVTEKANAKYLEYLFKTPHYINEFKKKSSGIGAGLTRLYTGDLYSIYFSISSGKSAAPSFLIRVYSRTASG